MKMRSIAQDDLPCTDQQAERASERGAQRVAPNDAVVRPAGAACGESVRGKCQGRSPRRRA
eukprot:29593-Pleurochrysis_carterae.AAC.1